MLNNVNENLNNANILGSQLQQTTGVDSAAVIGKKNPFDKTNSNYLIDELDISDSAIKLYQKDMDIKKFASLALSDPSDLTHDKIVASQMESGIIQYNDDEIIANLFNNSKFLKDLAG